MSFANETYDGVYSRNVDGTISFQVNKRTNDNGNLGTNLKSFDLDKSYQCRCAVDSKNYLVVFVVNPDTRPRSGIRIGSEDDCFLVWHCYTSVSHDEQWEAMGRYLQERLSPRE